MEIVWVTRCSKGPYYLHVTRENEFGLSVPSTSDRVACSAEADL